jgi:hypothetical protein
MKCCGVCDGPDYDVVIQFRYKDGPGDYDVLKQVVLADGHDYSAVERAYENSMSVRRRQHP